MKFDKTYDPKSHEAGIYELWEKSGIFTADPHSSKPHYSISMPPPNETGTLHIGSALFVTLQDILARHARSSGKDVLWLPGTDHAALPTNAIMERKLAEEGLSKHHIGREEFVRRTKEYVAANRDTINKQIRAMGASVDWSRYRYTLDDTLSRCVNEVFVKMYNDGLIYRGNRIVNWDPNLETNIADDEIEYIEEKGKLYTLKYGPFEITTARPETKFADKYVVMHPADKRYKDYKDGQQFEIEWINGKVTATVVKDEAVDPKFGTGVMTITPWHSQIDFEIAERQGLDKQQIIDLKGRLLPVAGEFSGMPINEAREKIVEKLKSKGLVIGIKDDYVHNLAINSRGKGIIEPQIRLQWFIDVNKPAVEWKGKKQSLKSVLQSVIKEDDIKLIPHNFQKIYYHWIDNLRDWCISRQIWWGHQVPVWYKGDETYVGVLPPESTGWNRDEDTLDTWFSSSLWTWSTLIDSGLAKDYSLSLSDLLQKSIDFKTYHPTTVLETGWDILFFWVARMILSTVYATKEVPFKTIYLHGLVRAESGKKMSKSDPNSIIDPLHMIEKYGCDALRLGLIQGMSAGTDQKVGESKFITNRNFANKLWNISRYIASNVDGPSGTVSLETDADHWIVGRLEAVSREFKADLDNFRFSDAYDRLYHFIWDDLADWYVEASKIAQNKPLLAYLLTNSLVLAQPLAPFVSEAIWHNLDWENSLLATKQYEEVIKADYARAKNFELIKNLITEVRRISTAIGQKDLELSYHNSNLIKDNEQLITKLCRVKVVNKHTDSGLKLSSVKNVSLNIDRIKAASYLKELNAKKEDLQNVIRTLRMRLENKSYVEKAPEALVTETKSQIEEANNNLKLTEEEINLFSRL